MTINRDLSLCGVPKRYITLGLCSFGMIIIHAIRCNLDVTILQEKNNIAQNIQELKGVGSSDIFKNETRDFQLLSNPPPVFWNSRQVGVLRGVFYLGFCLTQIPAGYLTLRLPSDYLFGAAIFFSVLLNVLIPTAVVHVSYVMTCLLRFLQGLCEGFLFPSAYALLWHWSPENERSRWGSIIFAGVFIGYVIGFPISGLIATEVGWQYSYYIFCGIGFAWCVAWIIFAHNKPEKHPTITEKEMNMLQERSNHTVFMHETIPWRYIFTSKHVYVLFFCNFAFNLPYTNEPIYITVFGFTFWESGLYVLLPHIALAVCALISGFMADCLIKDPMLNLTQIRRLFTCVSLGVEGFCYVCLTFISQGDIALIFLTIAVGFSGFSVSGWFINHIDIAPRYGSLLIGISNCFGVISGFFSPIAVGYLYEIQTIHSWQIALGCFGVILAIAAFLYGIFGTGETLPWGESRTDPEYSSLVDSMNNELLPNFLSPYIAVPAQLQHDESNSKNSKGIESSTASDWRLIDTSDSEDDIFLQRTYSTSSFESNASSKHSYRR